MKNSINSIPTASAHRVRERILGAAFTAFPKMAMPVPARSISRHAPKSRNEISMRISRVSTRCLSPASSVAPIECDCLRICLPRAAADARLNAYRVCGELSARGLPPVGHHDVPLGDHGGDKLARDRPSPRIRPAVMPRAPRSRSVGERPINRADRPGKTGGDGDPVFGTCLGGPDGRPAVGGCGDARFRRGRATRSQGDRGIYEATSRSGHGQIARSTGPGCRAGVIVAFNRAASLAPGLVNAALYHHSGRMGFARTERREAREAQGDHSGS